MNYPVSISVGSRSPKAESYGLIRPLKKA